MKTQGDAKQLEKADFKFYDPATTNDSKEGGETYCVGVRRRCGRASQFRKSIEAVLLVGCCRGVDRSRAGRRLLLLRSRQKKTCSELQLKILLKLLLDDLNGLTGLSRLVKAQA